MIAICSVQLWAEAVEVRRVRAASSSGDVEENILGVSGVGISNLREACVDTSGRYNADSAFNIVNDQVTTRGALESKQKRSRLGF